MQPWGCQLSQRIFLRDLLRLKHTSGTIVFYPQRAQDQNMAFPGVNVNLAEYCRTSVEVGGAPIALFSKN
jgi:hypothetical protein